MFVKSFPSVIKKLYAHLRPSHPFEQLAKYKKNVMYVNKWSSAKNTSVGIKDSF